MSSLVFILYLFFKSKTLKKFFLLIILFLIILSFAFLSNKKTFSRFFDSGGSIFVELGFKTHDKVNFDGILNTPHFKHFRSAIIIWEDNKILGSGLRTFRFNCESEKSKLILNNFYCSTHPHNLYFEFLSELGLIGIFFVVLFIYIFIKNFIFSININKPIMNNSISLLVGLGLFMILFPFQSTGAFFSSKNMYLNSLIFALFMANVNFIRLNKK